MKIFTLIFLFASLSYADCTAPDGGIFAVLDSKGNVLKTMGKSEDFEPVSESIKGKDKKSYKYKVNKDDVFTTLTTEYTYKNGKAKSAKTELRENEKLDWSREIEYEWSGNNCNIKNEYMVRDGKKIMTYDRATCLFVDALVGKEWDKATINQCTNILNKLRPALEQAARVAEGNQAKVGILEADAIGGGFDIKEIDPLKLSGGFELASECIDTIAEEKEHLGGFSNLATRGAAFKKILDLHDHNDGHDHDDGSEATNPGSATK